MIALAVLMIFVYLLSVAAALAAANALGATIGFPSRERRQPVRVPNTPPGPVVQAAPSGRPDPLDTDDLLRLEAADIVIHGGTFDGVPPATGPADVATADRWGRWWWRTFKIAEEEDHPIKREAYHASAHWFKIADGRA